MHLTTLLFLLAAPALLNASPLIGTIQNDYPPNDLERFGRPLSDKVSFIYATVLEKIKEHPSESPVPIEWIGTAGYVKNHLATYGDTPEFHEKLYDQYITNVKEELLITTFIYDQRKPTQHIIDALHAINDKAVAENRKVRVYVLIDPMGSWVFPALEGKFLPEPVKTAFASFVAIPRVEVNPASYHLPDPKTLHGVELLVKTYHKGIRGALHSKMMVIDGKMAIIGSKNLDGDVCMEYMAALEGPVAMAMRRDFNTVWNSDKTPLPALSGDPNSYLTVDRETHVPMLVVGRSDKEIHQPDHNEFSPQNTAWRAALQVARKTVYIQTPNICDKNIRDAIVQSLQQHRNLEITVVTSWRLADHQQGIFPSNVGNNHQTLESIIKELKTPDGKPDTQAIKRFKYCWFIGKRRGPNPTLDEKEWSHVKAMVVDDEFAIVGSGNQDSQSWYHSRENNVLIDDPKTARDIYQELMRQQESLDYCKQDH